MIGFMATDEVSLNGSPTVSPTTRGRMERSTFFVQLYFYDLFRVVPGAAGICHEDGLVKAEQRDGNQISDKEVGLQARKSQGGEKDRQEDVEHSSLRILGADFDDLLAVLHGSPFCAAVQLDVLFDEFNRAVGPGGNRLRRLRR